jgi:hypothetical protein
MAELDYDHFDGGYPAAASGLRFGRFAHLGGAALSVALVISGAVWAYQLAVRDVAGVPVIRAVVDPMRLAPSNPGGSQTLHQGLSVNAVAAAGTALPLPETLTLAPRPMELAEEDQAGLEPLEPVGGADVVAMAPALAPVEPLTTQSDAADSTVAAVEALPATQEDAGAAAMAEALGLPVKLHAEQLSNMGGSALAARYGALSCDHIEHLSAEGIAAMRQAGTVAVLLPGAYYTLRDTHMPPIAALREAGVPMAVSTDHNPGTSPALSLLLMLNMACTLFRLTVPEALAGVTRHAAQALGLQATHGRVAVGCPANFVLWPLGDVAELAYWLGQRPACSVVRQGCLAVDGMGVQRGSA